MVALRCVPPCVAVRCFASPCFTLLCTWFALRCAGLVLRWFALMLCYAMPRFAIMAWFAMFDFAWLRFALVLLGFAFAFPSSALLLPSLI